MGLILLLLALQIFLVFSIFYWFESFLPHVFGVVVLFTTVMSLYLLNSGIDPTAKITWLVVILLFQPFGALLYVYTQSDIGHRALKFRLSQLIDQTRGSIPQSEQVLEDFRTENPGGAQLAHYLQRSGCYPVYDRTAVTYFPSGEAKFAELLRQLEREFVTDDHRLWPKDAPDQPQQMPTPLPQKTWQKIGERMQTELDLRDKEAGDGADALKQQVKAANRSRRSYRDFLRRFCVLREEVKLDPDEFDLNFYTYGLSVYGNLPLIEPLESRESKKIEELALVIDTSYSTSGELVRAFLAETYTLLKGRENFFHRMNLHLIQADNAIRQDILIHNEDELIHAMNHFELRGGGGTDFRPAFAYVDQLCAEKKFSNLRGLLYFTDGMGTYPARRPGYDTAFLFLGERFDDANVPPWAMKVVLDEEEFTGAAARPASALADALAEEDDLYRELNNS